MWQVANKENSGKMYTCGVYIISKCIPGDFVYLISLDVYLLCHSVPCSARVKSEWSCASTPQYVSMAWCLIKQEVCFHGSTGTTSPLLFIYCRCKSFVTKGINSADDIVLRHTLFFLILY
jgi:hypothetical protein